MSYRRFDDPVTCKHCGELVIFVRTKKGKSMPCEAAQVLFIADPYGSKQILTRQGELVRGYVVERGEEADDARYGYMPHFGNCISSEARRRQEAYKRQGGSGIGDVEPKAPKKADKPEAPKAEFEQICLFGNNERRSRLPR